MDRRSFIVGSLASLVEVRRVLSFNNYPTTINYALFVDARRACQRYNLHRPFEHEGRVIATDSKILIASDQGLDELATARDTMLPPVWRLWWNEFERGGWRPLPKAPEQVVGEQWGECPTCCGTGRIGLDIRLCPTCGGETDGCGDCESGFVGGVKCDCQRGVIYGVSDRDDGARHGCFVDGETPTAERLGGAKFSRHYLERLRRFLADVEYRIFTPTPQPRLRLSTAVLAFRCAGGRGFVAAMLE